MNNDILKTFHAILAALRRRPAACFGLGLLAVMPPEIYSQVRSAGLEENMGVQLAWALPSLACQVWFLGLVGSSLPPRLKPAGHFASYFWRIFSAELLMSLKAAPWLMLGLCPGLLLLVIVHPVSCSGLFLPLILMAAGLVPGLVFLFRRLLAPAFVLWQGQGVIQSLQSSQKMVKGHGLAALAFIVIFESASFLAGWVPDLAVDRPMARLMLEALFLPFGFFLETAWMAGLYAHLAGGGKKPAASKSALK